MEEDITVRQRHSNVRATVRRALSHQNAILVGILVGIVAILAGLTGGLTVSGQNINNVLLQSASRGLASVGQAFVILTAGIDVSVGGVALLAANLGAALMTTYGVYNIVPVPFPPAAGLLIMLLVGFGCGVGNGFFVSRVGVPSLIVTLSVWRMTFGGAYRIGGGHTITGLPRSLTYIGQGYFGGVPISVIVLIGVCVVAYFVLYHTTYGRSIYAIGSNSITAWLSGVNVTKVRFSVYAVSGLLAALAAIVTVSRTLTASLLTMEGLELDSIAAVCIGGVSLAGGRGTLIGVILGVIILGVINNGMNVMLVDPATQDLVKGAIILSAVGVDFMRRR